MACSQNRRCRIPRLTPQPDHKAPLRRHQSPSEPLLDQPPTISEIVIAFRQRPHVMQMIRHDHSRVDLEWPIAPHADDNGPQQVDVAHQQSRPAVEEIHCEVITAAGYAATAIVGHGVLPSVESDNSHLKCRVHMAQYAALCYYSL